MPLHLFPSINNQPSTINQPALSRRDEVASSEAEELKSAVNPFEPGVTFFTGAFCHALAGLKPRRATVA
jgi:hypothetical protein